MDEEEKMNGGFVEEEDYRLGHNFRTWMKAMKRGDTSYMVDGLSSPQEILALFERCYALYEVWKKETLPIIPEDVLLKADFVLKE